MRTRYATALAFAIAFGAPVALRAQSTPIGVWHTFSDIDGKPRGIIEITEVNGEFIGTVKGTLVEGEQPGKVCDKCTDDRKGQPLMGMQILRGLKVEGDEWTGGRILDPDNGKVYKAKVRLIEGGKKLVLRGYIGFSLLGRSQTWVRAE